MRKMELLVPAGSPEVLKTAVRYGADAVYIGGEAFGLRQNAKNASNDELRECVEYAHKKGVKVFITANILAHNDDIREAENYFRELREVKPDALIISDPGMFTLAQRIMPETEIHISTQANNVNYETYNFWHRLGAKRVVAGRELSLKEIKEIRERIDPDLEIEAFVHGAMCISYSGRCLLSNFLTGRDANQGACTHPCRWQYSLMEETRPGEYFPVFENERGTFIFNSKDLCMIEHLDDLYDAGVDSLKIEGRMKTALYVATVARTYRRALDEFYRDPEQYEKDKAYFKEEIEKCTFRDYTTGFFYGKPGTDAQIYDSNTYIRNYIYYGTCGTTDENGRTFLEQKNKFSVGDVLEIMKPDGDNIETTVLRIQAEDGTDQESCPHARQNIYVTFSAQPEEGDILRGKSEENE